MHTCTVFSIVGSLRVLLSQVTHIFFLLLQAQFLVTASSDVLSTVPGTPSKPETGPTSGGSVKLKKAIQ